MKPFGRPFLDSEEWKSLPRALDPAVYREVEEKLDSDDISALIRHLETASIDDQFAVLHLLYGVIRHQRVPLTDEQKANLKTRLTSILARYPDAPALVAWDIFRLLAPELAEQFLFEEVDALQMPESAFRAYLKDLYGLKTDRAMERIVALSKLEDFHGSTAKLFLKNRGLIDVTELEELAAKWRESKSHKYLYDLYNFYVSHQGGKPLQPLLELLGAWNKHDWNTYVYYSDPDPHGEGHCLLLMEDGNGNLGSCACK